MADFNIWIEANDGIPSPIAEEGVAGETLYSGEIVYFNSDGKWYKATNTDHAKCSTEIRIVASPALVNENVILIIFGTLQTGGSLIRGTQYYIGGTAGTVTDTPPTSDAHIVRVVGTGATTSVLTFNPSHTYINGDGTKVNNILISSNDKNYVHEEGIPSALWTINHTLNKFPSVTVINDSGNEVIGAVDYTDNSNLTITFNAAFSGKAILN